MRSLLWSLQQRMQGLHGKRENGVGVVEVILILVVLIALVILFKTQITALADEIFGDIFTKAESVF